MSRVSMSRYLSSPAFLQYLGPLSSGNDTVIMKTTIFQGVFAVASLFINNTASLHAPSNGTQSSYPTKDQINTIFSQIAGSNPSFVGFFSHLADNFTWTIEGTHPLAGRYTNLTILELTFERITSTASTANPLILSLNNTIGGGDEEWSVQELEVKGICKSGLVFDNRYAWATRWAPLDSATVSPSLLTAKDGLMVEVRAYLDSALVSVALQENELGVLFTYNDERSTVVPFTDLNESLVNTSTGFARD
ncbi:hypothetical protein F5Y16DRAFT_391899 [Xylariaceae sp. FL0255]|nr:hypothetical protein F5Y16DRAFT_391899 [Xylariaceae sp. FL0255]